MFSFHRLDLGLLLCGVLVPRPEVASNPASGCAWIGTHAIAGNKFQAAHCWKTGVGNQGRDIVKLFLQGQSSICKLRGAVVTREKLLDDGKRSIHRQGPGSVTATWMSMAETTGQNHGRELSIPILAKKLDENEAMFGPMHPQVAKSLVALARGLAANGDVVPATEACQRALKILKRVYGTKSAAPEMAECLLTVSTLQQTSDPNTACTALTSCSMALEMAHRSWSPTDPKVVEYARTLARMSEHYAQWLVPGLPRPFYMPDPLPLYKQVVEIVQRANPEDSIEIAVALDDLAKGILTYRSNGDEGESDAKLPDGVVVAGHSVRISEGKLGPDHPDTATRVHRLGEVFAKRGEDEAARVEFRRAMEIRERVLGPDHADTRASRECLEKLET
ncbi:unnamed protein product [Discosporangium mesarthrocarpum]